MEICIGRIGKGYINFRVEATLFSIECNAKNVSKVLPSAGAFTSSESACLRYEKCKKC
jgi:hypothetical protein